LEVPPGSLAEQLLVETYRFDFFQAVRVLQRLFPDREPVGRDADPEQEVCRFRGRITLEMPASALYEMLPGPPGRAPELVCNFLSLAGASPAPLPDHYAVFILDRMRRRDYTLRDFLDLFHHRLISLFYRAWEKYQCCIRYELAAIQGRQQRAAGPERWRWFVLEERGRLDAPGQMLLDLIGLGVPALRYRTRERRRLEPRRQIADDTLRFYAGLFAQRHRSAIGLERLLEDYFGVPVQVVQFCGQWLLLEEEHQTSLGGGRRAAVGQDGGGLGRGAVAGSRVWERQSKFRLRIGPLSYAQFRTFVPSGPAFKPLVHLTRLYVGQEFDFDVQLVLRGPEVPGCVLPQAPAGSVRLGWDAWVHNAPFSTDVADAVFTPQDDSSHSAAGRTCYVAACRKEPSPCNAT
jgi:type VI secretion system protein ImpH